MLAALEFVDLESFVMNTPFRIHEKILNQHTNEGNIFISTDLPHVTLMQNFAYKRFFVPTVMVLIVRLLMLDCLGVELKIWVSGKQGFEPRFHDLESCVHADHSPRAKYGPNLIKIAYF